MTVDAHRYDLPESLSVDILVWAGLSRSVVQYTYLVTVEYAYECTHRRHQLCGTLYDILSSFYLLYTNLNLTYTAPDSFTR